MENTKVCSFSIQVNIFSNRKIKLYYSVQMHTQTSHNCRVARQNNIELWRKKSILFPKLAHNFFLMFYAIETYLNHISSMCNFGSMQGSSQTILASAWAEKVILTHISAKKRIISSGPEEEPIPHQIPALPTSLNMHPGNLISTALDKMLARVINKARELVMHINTYQAT